MSTAKQPADYGPIQLVNRLGLATWQVERAMEAGVLSRPDVKGARWSRAVVEDAAARIEQITAAAGAVPDVGAHRAATYLSKKLGVEVAPDTVMELSRRGLVPEAGEYKGNTLYDGRALEAFDDLVVLQRAAVEGHLRTADESRKYLRIRRSDLDHLVNAGWLVEVDFARSSYQRSSAAPMVPLYRTGDLDVLLAHPAIDWDEVRATSPGRPSPLANLKAPRRTVSARRSEAYRKAAGA
jgi:hypothetical protein